MEIVYAVPILAMLVFALVTANRVAKRNRLRRRMLKSAIGGDKRALRFKDKESSQRSEMRAFNDPSTVMGEIRTTTSAPDFGQKRRSKKRRK
jgi:hypothetical protein